MIQGLIVRRSEAAKGAGKVALAVLMGGPRYLGC